MQENKSRNTRKLANRPKSSPEMPLGWKKTECLSLETQRADLQGINLFSYTKLTLPRIIHTDSVVSAAERSSKKSASTSLKTNGSSPSQIYKNPRSLRPYHPRESWTEMFQTAEMAVLQAKKSQTLPAAQVGLHPPHSGTKCGE